MLCRVASILSQITDCRSLAAGAATTLEPRKRSAAAVQCSGGLSSSRAGTESASFHCREAAPSGIEPRIDEIKELPKLRVGQRVEIECQVLPPAGRQELCQRLLTLVHGDWQTDLRERC